MLGEFQEQEGGGGGTEGRDRDRWFSHPGAVWVKCSGYAWWPAKVVPLEELDVVGMPEADEEGLVPVKFFGTYEVMWIDDMDECLSEFTVDTKERSTKVKTKAFKAAVTEGKAAEEGILPDGFMDPPPPSPRATKSKRGGGSTGDKRKGGADRPPLTPEERKLKVLRGLGLVPPLGSPYVGTFAPTVW